MGRAITWVLLGAGLAALAAFLLLDLGRDAPDGDPVEYDGATAADEDGPQAPSLRGTARSAGGGTGAAGTYVVRGRVVGEDMQPRAAVAVEAYLVGRAQDPRDPVSMSARPAEIMSRLLAALGDPYEAEAPRVAAVETGTDGTFEIALEAPARYELRARPAPPAVGTYDQVNVHDGRPEADVTLVLLDGGVLHGRVLDTQDHPVAATLKARWWDYGGNVARRWTSGLFDNDPADGSFRIAGVPPGKLYFAVYVHGGPKLTSISAETPHEGEFVIRVPASDGVVRGQVTDAEGRAVSGAAIAIMVATPKEAGGVAASARAACDAEGRYRLEGLAAGSVTRVDVLASGFLPLTQQGPDAPWHGVQVVSGKALDLDLVLSRGGKVHGRVLSRGSERPLEGATVSLLPARKGNAWPSSPVAPATADAAGRYELAGVPTGRYALLPRHPDHYLAELARPNAGAYTPSMQGATAPASLTIVVTGDATDIERDLELVPGLPLRGRVVDDQGDGVAGADVHARGFGASQLAAAWGVGGMRATPLATSAEDGGFEIRGLPPRENWVLYARKKGLVGSFSAPVVLQADAPVPTVTLKLLVGAVIRGRVVGGDEAAVAGARVGAWGRGMELSGGARGARKVERDGSFEIRDVPPGDWTINVWVHGRAGAQQEIKGLAAGEVRDGVVLELLEGVQVAGVLVDGDGKGAAGVSLTLHALSGGQTLSATSDGQGAFRFEGVKAGQVQLSVWTGSLGARALGAPFEAPRTDLRFVHKRDPVATVTGTVLDPAGKPVPLALLEILPASKDGRRGEDWRFGGGSGVEAVNGKFRQQVEGNPPYTVVVKHARGEDGHPLNVQTARQLVKDPSQPVVIRLLAGLEISGRVLDSRGRGVPDVALTTGNHNARTAADGFFTLSGLAEGDETVHVRPGPGFVRPPMRRVPAGTKDLVFRLLPAVKIRGVVYDTDGAPLGRGHVSGSWETSGRSQAGSVGASVGPDGRFALDGIPDDVLVRVQLQAFAIAGGAAHAPVVIEGVRPGTDDLVVRLGQGLTISGVVVDAAGRPAARCFVQARSRASATRGKSKGMGWVQTAEDGSWTLAGLESGGYVLTVQPPDGAAAPGPMEVDAPATGVRIVLPKSGVLFGRIEGLDPEVATRWRVRVWREDMTSVKSVNANADGTWRIGAVPGGRRYRIGAQYWRDGRYASAGPLSPGDTEIVLRLKQGRSIRGIVDLSAVPEGMGVSIVAQSKTWHAPGFVDKETGRFEINGLPPGTYALSAKTYVGAYSAAVKSVEAGTDGVSLRLEPR